MMRSLPEIRKLRRAMRKAGALSPDTALPPAALNDIISSDIDVYVDADVLRVSPTGDFYLDEPNAARAVRDQTIKMVVFWLIVVLLPVALLQLTNTR